MSLTVDDTAFDLLIDAGFDPVYGARPLKRAIQQQIENTLAQKSCRVILSQVIPFWLKVKMVI